ncbi:hypothetical protein OSTOST_02917 [Ostertagia ostertagi]
MTEFKTCNVVDAFPGNSFVDSIAFGKLSLKSAKEEESEDDGSGLWLDEAWHWFVTVENNNLVEASILKMFVRLSVECPGSVDWTDKLDVIFTKIPASMRLTQVHLDEFVTQMLPCLKLAMFSKARNDVYPALETLTEPHRLLQALQVLVAVAPVLAKDQPDKNGKTFRIHAINLMNSLLPGLDQNDMGKCLTTFQIVGVLVNLIPLVDCSDAIHLRSDLTEDEKELCSATANFDSIIAMFMDKLLSMMMEYGEAAAFTGSHTNINTKTRANMDDHILHRGTISVFKGICRNSSTELYKVAVDRLYTFMCENVFDSKTVSTAIADMVFVAVKMYPSLSFVRFFSLIKKKLQQCICNETYSEEKVDFQVIWWLSMADRVLKAPSSYLLENWADVRAVLELVLPLKKCTLATEKAAAILESVLEGLCSIYLLESPTRRANADKNLEDALAIRVRHN